MKRILLGAVWGVALSVLAAVAVLYFADLRVTHEPTVEVSDLVGTPLSEAEAAVAAGRLRPRVVGLARGLSTRQERRSIVARQLPVGGTDVPGGSTVTLYVKGK